MQDGQNSDHFFCIVDLIEHAVVTHAQTVGPMPPPSQEHSTLRPGLLREMIDRIAETMAEAWVPIEAFKVLDGSSDQLDREHLATELVPGGFPWNQFLQPRFRQSLFDQVSIQDVLSNVNQAVNLRG